MPGKTRPTRQDDEEFAVLFEKVGATETARRLNRSVRAVYQKRQSVERRMRRKLRSPVIGGVQPTRSGGKVHPGRIEIALPDGVVLIGSDCHYWPGPPSLMHRAFVHFCREMRPKIVVMNGDVIDACSISRHLPIGWTSQPTVQQEIEAAQERLGEIEKAASRAQKIWCGGNHDFRFETRLATVAYQYAKVHGTSLQDHFPLWQPCWSVFINELVVKHRFRGGALAPRNNTIYSGRSIVTGHLHSANAVCFTDYNGTRWGIDTGCIADPNHRAFLDYTEDSSRDWRDAFLVATFRGGRFMPPELVHRWDNDHVVFRGEVIRV